MTQEKLSIYFSEKFGQRVPRQTIADILADECRLLGDLNIDSNAKRITKGRFHLIEECLILWLADVRSHGVNVNDDLLKEQAKLFGARLGFGLEFKYSNYKQVVSCELIKLTEIVAKYSPSDVYNFDETALFYRLQPNRTLASQAVNGIKSSKERLSVGVCSNADGSDKCRLVVIGKFVKPRCFGNFDPNNHVNYFANQKAWMTSGIFTQWLEKFNNKMKNSKRQVLLLIDNAASHKILQKFSNVSIHFLPPSNTSVLQPMDAGIIRSFKINYKNLLVKSFIKSIELENKVILPNVKDAILMMKLAWYNVSSETISNCFSHCNFMSKKKSFQLNFNEKDPKWIELKSNIDKFNISQALQDPVELLHVEDYVASDDNQSTGEKLEVEDIIELVKPGVTVSDNEQVLTELDVNDKEPVKVTKEEVLISFKNLKIFFDDSCMTEDKDLECLNYISDRIDFFIDKNKKQSNIFDYFKKN
ncbi:unnamed protein product [Brachionus calyciflorus]|uniref:DDE-1 domain-containing protein n=1 Tax=Brachionus calyciflorus TaxID=104777 RepID=A0A814L139_9BILA|nr:unnamed protein product [Brachionus calyciflorus]